MSYKIFTSDNLKKIIIVSLSVFAVSACSTNKKIVPKEAEKPAYVWYNEGVQEYIYHKYDDAEHSLDMVNEQHPGSVYAKRANLILGDVYFAKEEYILARDYYLKFIKLYPTSSDAVHAQYKIALSYYKSMNGYKLDSTPARMAVKEFLKLLKKYPNNPYKEKAYNYMSESALRIYEHELFVAKFYDDLGYLKAADNRLEYMNKHFKNAAFNGEMLYLLSNVNYYLGKYRYADKYFKELKQKFPESEYVQKLNALLKNIKTKGK